MQASIRAPRSRADGPPAHAARYVADQPRPGLQLLAPSIYRGEEHYVHLGGDWEGWDEQSRRAGADAS